LYVKIALETKPTEEKNKYEEIHRRTHQEVSIFKDGEKSKLKASTLI
jgi:hypothetical protein